MQLSFTFPLTFANPVLSFAFRAGTVRLLDLQASFTVDATVTATAQLARTGGTLVLQSLGARRLAAPAGRPWHRSTGVALEG